MPRAEVGSAKWVANGMKMKGLQRLRWYCQACSKQMRDENGFKQHTLSEGHVRTMLSIGQDPRKYINDFSNQFKRDFLQLLRTAHGEKKIYANHFYQEYIADKQHVHMNSTKWPSLTEFVKQLGREGTCRVEEGERGLQLAWIDDSPEALRRKEVVAKKDRMAKGDEEREAQMLEAKIKRAQEQKTAMQSTQEPVETALDVDEVVEPEDSKRTFASFSFSLGAEPDLAKQTSGPNTADQVTTSDEPLPTIDPVMSANTPLDAPAVVEKKKEKPVNPFKSAKTKTKTVIVAGTAAEPVKQMSQAERIMRREMEMSNRRIRHEPSSKKPRLL